MVFFSKCGSENADENVKCEKCGEFLTKREYLSSRSFENFQDIFTEKETG